MRSIHKKTLKRFLSTLLALTMVLGMVPFTASAAAPVTLTQSDLTATITPSEPAAATAGSQSTVTYAVMIEATAATADGQAVTLTIDGTPYSFGTVYVSGGGGSYTITPASSLPAGFIVNAAGKITGAVTKDYAFGSYNVEMSLTVGGGVPVNGSTTITVPRKADLTLTAPTGTITAGQDFTVTAESDINNGYIEFAYNGVSVTAPVMPRSGGGGYATHTFTAVADKDTVTAKQFGMSDGVVDSDVKNATFGVNAATVYHTITYAGNAVDAYNVPAAGTVANGGTYTVTDAKPNRTGYQFVGWSEDKDAATATYTGTGSETITNVTSDKTLYAVWAKNQVTVHYPASGPTGANVSPNGDVIVPEGSTQNFTVTLTEGYDPATLTVTADGVALAPVAIGSTGVYQYSFVANANTVIHVLDLSKLQYTIALPTGDNFNAVFTSTGDANKTSVVKEYDDTYSFKVDPVGNYKVKAVYVNGAGQTGTSGVYGPFTVKGPQTISIVMEAIQFCTVTYVVDGAQLTTRQVQNGSPIPSDVKAPTKTGYDFDGWYTASDFTSTKDSLGNAASDCEVYGRYVPKTYWINYDLQSTSLTNPNPTSIPSTKKTFGQAVALSAVVPTATNYVFKGWATSATGPAVYQPGDTYSAESTANDSGVYQDVTLYAVWEIKTYHVTLVPGAGVTAYAANYEVAYGSDFNFTVIVERDYAATLPTVTVTPDSYTASKQSGDPDDDGAATYTYQVASVLTDLTINIRATQNPERVVTFKYDLYKSDGITDITDSPDGVDFDSQKVEHGYYAVRPATPVLEGYKFDGWYTKVGSTLTPYNFDTIVTSNITVYAKMTAIEPKVELPADNLAANGWWISFSDTSNADTNAENATVAYKDEKTFYIFVADGYDATNMQVAANGYKLAPVTDATTVNDTSGNPIGKLYTFTLYNITEDQTVTVTGVVRKTVTVTYMPNAKDDVSGWTGGQEQINYSIGADDDGRITSKVPSRTGYTFLGWSLDADRDPAEFNTVANDARDFVADEVAGFTTDTTLYAIWKAEEVTVELTFSDILGATGEWEKDAVLKETFNLVATFNQPVIGDVTFKKTTIDDKEVTLGTVAINGGKSVALKDVEAGSFLNENPPIEKYWVEFKANADEGYSDANSAKVDLRLNSRALTWKFVANGNKLTIKNSNGTTVDSMTAGQTYTLELPDVVALNAVQYAGDIVAGTQYRVKWQYRETAKSGWVTAQEDGGDTYLVTSEFSGYAFRALVEPMDAPFTKAATYVDNTVTAASACLINDKYALYLETLPTADTVRQETETGLEITGADNEAANVVINGADDVFTAAHLAQFEGQTVTLKATVVDKSTGKGVPSVGFVNFYRYVATGDDELLNITPVEVGANGVATFEVTISDYSTASGQTALTNVDRFYAVYLVNDTYDTSASVTKSGTAYSQPGDEDSVWIKSTAIQTPVIDAKRGTTDEGSTSYAADLTDLLAGVEHTFTLRTTGAAGVAGQSSDWSVVALDGREVASSNYTIQWNVKTGDNTVTDATVGGTFVTTDNKVGDEISVTLNPKGDMTKGNTSKKAIIGTKQDVTVTVTASDKIDSTTDTDAYQLDEVTLTATVAAKETGATMPPTGTVTFYYSVDDGAHWTQVGDTTDLSVVAGKVTAKIKTTQLPVKAVDNTKQTVKVTAIYHGDSSFFESGTYNADETITENANAVLNDAKAAITVYSSVVYVNSTVENKAVTCSNDHASGIYISVIDGALNANETNVTLQLSDVYTLDHDDALSKLAFGTDYTVQWQKLSNAAAYTDYAASTAPWANIPGKTNTTCDLVVEQGAAYRAVITVGPETDINRGSYTKVDQDIDGRQVYYSNVLVAGSGDLDLTVTINTSKTEDGFEGIVEGETVTINTFASGATNTTPISELTVTVTKQGETDPVFEKVKTDVNGYTSFDWATTAPGYYTLKVTAVPSNGYAAKTVTRTLIVRDDKYDFEIVNNITSKVYNGKAQGLTVTVNNMGIENELAQDSVVVYYYSDAARTQMVEPSDAGTYYATIRLQESAYWTEKTENVTFTITKRPVSVVDLVAQAKVYDGTTAANLQEIVLNDAAVDAAGVPIDNTGVLNGDSIYATGTGYTSSENVGTVALKVKDVTLKGDDAKNYELVGTYAGENFVIMRNQLKGDIADATYAYTGSSITVPADDIAVIDQQGNNFTDYTVTYYYHNGDGVEKVGAMKELGLYTVVVTPKDTNNYKGGAAQKVYVAATTTPYAAPSISYSATISITNTVELYGHTNGVVAKATKGDASVQYYVNGAWTGNVPTDAGRYLVKATASTGDTAYGLYTIVKADPALSLSASDAVYNSAPQTGSPALTGAPDANQVYYTWTGGTIQGVSYTAPTEVGKYVVTAHVNETANYTAHEVSATFEIKPVTLTITADSYQRHQYGEYPQMTATFSGLAIGGVARDTSLRDVQIQPEFLFSGNNDALDQAGNYIVTPVSALARNYTVEYVDGLFTVNQVDGNPELAICGMISNGNGDKTIAYYGDAIQLYAYGSQKNNVINNSSIWTWGIKSGNATITPEGLLTFGNGDQYVTVSLTRGTGTQSIYTEITIHVLKQEVKVNVPDVDKVYKADVWTYDGSMSAVNAKGEQMFAGNSKFTIGSNTRTDIGTQVVTGKVADTIVSYQSETYGGRFTVNDKNVTVTPNTQTVTYGDNLSIAENEFGVDGKVGSVDPLTSTTVASVRELYNNLDVANEYEILVTGTENINYNVKYVTAPTAPQVTVTDRTLNVKTGVYAGTTGQTSGSLNPAGEYPNDDRLAFSASDLNSFAQTTTRMYGEPNQVMGYVLETLVDGDSEADLTDLLDWLVKYDFNIAGHASVTYSDKSTQIDPADYDAIYATTIATKGASDVAGTQRIDSSMNLVNYAENYLRGTQNIYQRPVTLKLSNSQTTLNIYFAEILMSDGTIDTAKLLNIIINNVEAGKYNDGTNYVGGLAELLKHTVKDLDLQVAISGYTGSPDTQFTATVTVGNPNYWLGNAGQKFDITVNILPQRLTVDYTTFTATFSDVVLYQQSATTRVAAYATNDVTFKIYRYVEGKENYSYYAANEATVFSGTMTKDTSRTGRYYVTYPKLSAGTYRVFAVASGYTIID